MSSKCSLLDTNIFCNIINIFLHIFFFLQYNKEVCVPFSPDEVQKEKEILVCHILLFLFLIRGLQINFHILLQTFVYYIKWPQDQSINKTFFLLSTISYPSLGQLLIITTVSELQDCNLNWECCFLGVPGFRSLPWLHFDDIWGQGCTFCLPGRKSGYIGQGKIQKASSFSPVVPALKFKCLLE